METRQWETRQDEKAKWGRGPWTGEPDKVQWIDEATGLDCLIVRGPLGALCGYVGVQAGHPWFGKDYNECAAEPPCGAESWECRHRADGMVRVHGGITFADRCREPTEDQWLQAARMVNDPALIEEATRYPHGDAAERLADLRVQAGMTLGEWMEREMARRICHVPEPGRGEAWWFGFDCAHAWDIAPGSSYRMREILGHDPLDAPDSSYKGLGYVRREVAGLAAQLHAVAMGAPLAAEE